jgi:hypothetical protein
LRIGSADCLGLCLSVLAVPALAAVSIMVAAPSLAMPLLPKTKSAAAMRAALPANIGGAGRCAFGGAVEERWLPPCCATQHVGASAWAGKPLNPMDAYIHPGLVGRVMASRKGSGKALRKALRKAFGKALRKAFEKASGEIARVQFRCVDSLPIVAAPYAVRAQCLILG